MPSLTHILDITLLVLVAYLIGCVIGYVAHRVLYAGRGTRQVPAVATATTNKPDMGAPPPRRVPSTAARLASAGFSSPSPR